MAEILIYGIVGDAFDKLDAKTVAPLIRSATGPLSLRINSPGGYVMEGLAIVAAIRDCRHKVTAYVDGLAASMASVIAAAADEVVMAGGAMMMIHKPWDSAIGNAADLRQEADKLDRIEAQLIGIYAKRTGLEAGEIAAMLAAETWMTAEEAVERGFATTIAPDLKIAAMADVSACGFRNVPSSLSRQESTMTDQTQASIIAERTRVTTINALCMKHGLGEAMALDLINKGTSLDRAREAILDRLAEAGDAAGVGHSSPHNSAAATFDNPGFHAKAVGDALYARLSGTAPPEHSREMMGVAVVDLAREMLHRAGVQNAIRLRPADVLHPERWQGSTMRAYGSVITTTTSDFPSLLQGAGARFLLDRYAAAASVLKQLARTRSVPDFRTITGVQLGGFGTLEGVNEAGEFKNGTFTERAESYRVSTFGKMFNLSRQALINDDLGAFADILSVMGRAAAETEAVFLAALLASNPTMKDGNAVFSAAHGNLAGSGAAPGLNTLSAARLAMRSQKDLDGETPLNVVPKFIVAGAAQETNVEVAIAAVTAPDTESVNPFAGKLTPLIDPRITGNTWYLFGDPNVAPPVLEMAYLNGVTEPFLDSMDGWRVDGTEYKVRHDFGGAFVDWKGAFKNPGTA